jgi:porin
MNIKVKACIVATIFLTALFVFESEVYSQTPTPPPTPAAREPVADKAKSEGENAPKVAPHSPAQAPIPGYWGQEEATGDWGGTRTRWKEKGVELEFSLTNFYQGVASGGARDNEGKLIHDSEYTGKFQTAFKFDLGKLAGWNFWHAEIRTEWRFGGPLVSGTGTISPVNTSAIIPGAAGSVFTVSAVNVTKLFPIDLKKGDLFAVSVGRFNLVDVLEEDFFGGRGTERFWNIAQIGPLTVLRQVPLITNAVTFAYIRGGEPFITLAVMDPNDQSTDPGLEDLFGDGVTFAPGISFPVKYFGKSGKHSFGGAVTTKKYTPFDAIKQITIPGPPINPIEPQGGSWSFNYIFRQYIVERDRKDGWGFFTQLAFADKATSPITKFFNFGLGGNGLFESRQRDEFGIAWAYTDLSKVLTDNLALVAGRQYRAEHQIEMFYNFHIAPWLRLTGDLQIFRPTRPNVNTTIVPGVRLEIKF